MNLIFEGDIDNEDDPGLFHIDTAGTGEPLRLYEAINNEIE